MDSEALWDFAWRMFVLRHIWAFDRTNTQMWKRHWLKFVITTRNPKEPKIPQLRAHRYTTGPGIRSLKRGSARKGAAFFSLLLDGELVGALVVVVEVGSWQSGRETAMLPGCHSFRRTANRVPGRCRSFRNSVVYSCQPPKKQPQRTRFPRVCCKARLISFLLVCV